MSLDRWYEHKQREALRREILDAREEEMEDQYQRLARRLQGPRLVKRA